MKKPHFLQHLNWKILLIRILVNAFAIGLVALLVPQIYFAKITLLNVLIVGLALGILNALVKPALMFLTAQLFFATFGLLVILINALLLYLLDWIFPQVFVVQSLLWAIVGGAILGLVSNTLENFFGVYPPIVPGGDAALVQRIREQSVSPLQSLVGDPVKRIGPAVETQSLAEFQAAKAALDLLEQSAPAAAPQAEAAPLPPEEPAQPDGGEA